MTNLLRDKKDNLSDVLKFIVRYLLAIAMMNLIWEVLQMPLYKIWNEGSAGQILFDVIHCTLGDILIACLSLILALVIVLNCNFLQRKYSFVSGFTIIIGFLYTVYSEWMNLYLRQSWSYTDQMPVLPFSNFEIGLSPLLQWIIIPPLAFWWTNKDGSYDSVNKE